MMLISFTCMFGLAYCQTAFACVDRRKWLPAVEYLQIICFAGMLYPLHALNLNILHSAVWI
jgi:hypothetical protein